jgi:hypothetical protein
MRARLTRDYTPPPEWGLHAFPAGLEVTGDLAAMALKDGAAVPIGPELETKVTPPAELKRRGRPPKAEAA